MEFTTEQVLDGVRLHMLETDKFKTMTVKVFIQQDLTEEYVTETAILPRLLIRGSKNHPTSRDLARKMENLYGAGLGADILKIGERQIIEGYFDIINPSLLSDGEQVLREGITTLWEILTEPVNKNNAFLEEYFQQEKNNMAKQIEGLINNKRAYAMTQATSHMCAEEPFKLYKYGNLETLEGLSSQSVYDYYQSLITNYPIDIFVVGNDVEQFSKLFSELRLKRGPLKKLNSTTEKTVEKVQEITETRDVQQAILVMGYRTQTNYLAKDYYSLIVYNGILGGFPHSKLFVNVREKASLAYFVGSSLEGTKGLLMITAGISSDHYGQAVNIIKQQVDAIRQGEITDEELTKTKKALISGIQSIADKPTGLIDRNVLGLVNGEIRMLDEVVQRIESVTRDEVVKIAQKIQLDTIYFLTNTGGE